MVYISSWQDYQVAAEKLYERSPTKTRYCVKWKSSEGTLVLKITDNTTCLKFKTYSSIFLNRFEAFNVSLMEKMQNRQPIETQTSIAPKEPTPPAGSSILSSAPLTPGASTGGVKKKKPKKKK